MKDRNQLSLKMHQGIFEEICDQSTLQEAFKAVRRNKGAPGVDKVTIGQFQKNLQEELQQLKEEILNWTYKPSPVKRVEIPKPGGKGVRLLGIPTIKDRVLHMAIKIVLEPIIDPTFSKSSFGFRPGRGQREAIQTAQQIVQSGKEYVVDIDLEKFFDKINHDRLIHRLKTYTKDTRVLRLIGMILRSGAMINGIKAPTPEGSVQGSPLSPLLSNVVLDELDKELENRGLKFCRYADDCNIFAGSKKAAERVMQSIKKFIEKKLKLKVNEGKSKTAKSDKVKFLGLTIVNGLVAISKISLERAMEKVKRLIPRGTHLILKSTIKEINQWYTGWGSYYNMTQYPAQLNKIEAHIRRRLRARIVSQQKRKRHLLKRLVQMGVNKKKADRTVYSNRGVWALSHTRALEEAFSVEWFIREGQRILSHKRLPHWLDIKDWVKLT